MKKTDLNDLFIDELKGIYNAEHQIIKFLPDLIKWAVSTDLQEALTKHLKETENQVLRLEKIFLALGLKSSELPCAPMESLISEMNKFGDSSATLDAALIMGAQKIKHYEIASYGTLRSFAKQLNFEAEIINLLTETLDEEGAMDKKLTKIAEGSVFESGVNKEATPN